jgi:uroporphyrinogen-III synthase
MADSLGSAGALIDALNNGVVVGCIGPVCASAAQQEGIREAVVPENWRLGSLVKAVAEALS